MCREYPLIIKGKIRVPERVARPIDIIDRGTIKEFRFFNYILEIMKM